MITKSLPRTGKAFALAAHTQSLPFQGRWLGEAETERLQQICDDLSVSLRLTAPLKGEPRGARLHAFPWGKVDAERSGADG